MTVKYSVLILNCMVPGGVVLGRELFRSYGMETNVNVCMYPSHIKELRNGNCDGLR